MKDSTHIKAASKKDTEQPLLQNKDDLSSSVHCLSEMKKIASLIEAVRHPFSTLSPSQGAQAVYSPFLLLNRF